MLLTFTIPDSLREELRGLLREHGFTVSECQTPNRNRDEFICERGNAKFQISVCDGTILPGRVQLFFFGARPWWDFWSFYTKDYDAMSAARHLLFANGAQWFPKASDNKSD